MLKDRHNSWRSWGPRKRLSLTNNTLGCHVHVQRLPPGCTGGSGTRKEVGNGQLLGFMQRMLATDASKSGSAPPYLLTVCTGAALAARAGLLDGKKATTNKVESPLNPDIIVVLLSSEVITDS